MKKKLISALLTASLILAAGCGQAAPEKTAEAPAADAAPATESSPAEETPDVAVVEETTMDEDGQIYTTSLAMTVNNADGRLNINRAEVKNEPMGPPGTWTIFVYLCGTDLESSGQGSASGDVVQMLEATANDNVQFVIQTGGTYEWMNEYFDPSVGERWLIKNQELELVDSVELGNMGDPKTLSDFLSWGVENYPAEKMGVILWDHGSGSVNGVCFDEIYDSDSLSLPELNQAFSEVYGKMTDQFEFIGFDCCLMGTLETANTLATYARYFYGSQEIEPGTGWDYTAIGNFLAENNNADGADLGKVVSDSFYDECATLEQESGATFSIVDLDKIDELSIAFNDYAMALYEVAGEDISSVVRGVEAADNFGGNNRSEGYTNMVDIGGIVANCADYVDGTAVMNALADCLVYNVNGSTHANASGLSIYYPLEVQGSEELTLFSEICPSPYFISLVDMIAQGYSEEGYTNDEFFSEDGEWYSEDLTPDYSDDSYFGYADEYESEESELITFEVPPYMDENGDYGFKLDEQGLEYAAVVKAHIYLYDRESDQGLDLGETYDVLADWETGEIYDNFDGYWLALPNGQVLPTYIADTTDEYTVLTSPILLNGERTNLRVRQYDDYSVIVEGAWDGIDENGAASREIKMLHAGDEVTPICYLDDDSEVELDPYIWQDGDTLAYDYLPPSDYFYCFEIDDVYGDFYVTDMVMFTIDEEGTIFFTDLTQL